MWRGVLALSASPGTEAVPPPPVDTSMCPHSPHRAEEDGRPLRPTQPRPAGTWPGSAAGEGRKDPPVLEPSGRAAGGGREEGCPADPLAVSRLRSSSVEIREKGSEFLKEELHKAQKELKLKDEECERLSKVREQLEQELEELTASLFEEAHKMVREANTKQAASEKQLMEARGKIDMLQAEVTALKTLVITSTPSSPNRELHPQLLSPTKAAFRKGHSRNKSTSSAAICPAACPAACPAGGHSLPFDPAGRECKEMDSNLFAEFQAWKESPTLDKACPFLERIYREDVGPCLDFSKRELSELVRAAVEENTLTIEPVASQTLPVVKMAALECGGPNGLRAQVVTKCALSGLARACRHRIKLGDSGNYYYISPSCRARITAVCNFFTYVRYIQQGLVRQDAELMFWQIMRLRKEMSLAKLGFYPSEA
ncbi:guanine nucleotide exchange factor for Rab-3A isoform X1 [Ornithorhynchus anatinus]|uniref:RAB3A interacting protein like 1 n=1 Tax=Ornithorhynchus anatinus TaxID=9258 RepID=A0A6I8NSV7_ORNAN|nr:guanine nucleotide exchange factor for Rab-3A isoform X1 [Ornithorhynchus anatinus]